MPIILWMVPAFFLDRDGVIIENRESYVRRWEDVAFIPGALEALARIRQSPFRIIILTNQSAVGRGLLTIEQARDINEQILETIDLHGGRVDAVYMCPHAPEQRCSCRKPQPGLFFQAAEDLSVDLSRSIMIGDALSDLQAGENAGLAERALVLTGRGRQQLLLQNPVVLKPYPIFDSLSEAVDHFSRLLLSSDDRIF